MKSTILISVIILIILVPLALLGFLFYKNYYFPDGFSAVYDLKEESRFITPLKPLSAVGPIEDSWSDPKQQGIEGKSFLTQTRIIFQKVIDDFVYTDIFLPKRFEKLSLNLLYRADTPELRVCLKTGAEEENWSCQIFYTEKQAGNWFTLGASWNLSSPGGEAYQIKRRHYRIGIFAPGLNENKGLLEIKRIEIEAY